MLPRVDTGRAGAGRAAAPISNIKTDWLIAAALAAAAVLPRLPYLALIPRFDDEAMETVLALTFRPGAHLPLVGIDAYAQPFFCYLLALCLWLFGSNAIVPRIVIMVMGALTVGLTYWLARASGLGRGWAMLAGLLLLANPHHIVINSHLSGASYTVPFFGAAFLAALTLAVRRESGRWLVAAGALAGLAISNPMFAVVLPGAALWFLARRPSRIGLKTRWPYLGALGFLLAYSPVILYNLQNQFEGVGLASIVRSYIWQPNPTLQTFASNFVRLMLQLARQVSGVLLGGEGVDSLSSLPLLMALWALAALFIAARRGIGLPLFAVISQAIIMPWFSNHYGVPVATRYTNQLSPLLFVAMAALAESAWNWAAARLSRPRLVRIAGAAVALLLVAVSLWPLNSLASFYQYETAQGETNTLNFAFADEFMRQWRGEKLVLSLTNWYSVAEYFFAVNRVPYTTMPVGRLLEHLAMARESGPAVVLLYNDDLPAVRAQTELIEWTTPAMRAAQNQLGYSLYTIPDVSKVRKPPFVLQDSVGSNGVGSNGVGSNGVGSNGVGSNGVGSNGVGSNGVGSNGVGSNGVGSNGVGADTLYAPDVRRAEATFADPSQGEVTAPRLGIVGYRVSSDRLPEDGRITVNVFWKALAPMSEAYTGFVHLVGPDGQVAAQDDHELGRGVYRTLAWTSREMIRERYELTVPQDKRRSEYRLHVGVYRFPSLTRLAAQSTTLPVQDNIVTLDTLQAGP